MSDDPMRLGGLLDTEALAEASEAKKKGKANPVALKNAETAAKREERLATKNAPAMGGGGSAPVPEPDVDKSALLDKIGAYREKFPHVKSRNKVSGKASLEEIEDELHYIERQLGQKDGNVGHQLFYLALSGLEQSTHTYNPLNLNLNGLGQIAQQNKDQFTPILDELFIKYAVNMHVGPEMRLAMATATPIYTVHSANSGNATVARAMEAMSRQAPTAATDL